jgi:TPR repeat protein
MRISRSYPNQSVLCCCCRAIGVGGQAHALDPNSGCIARIWPVRSLQVRLFGLQEGRKDEAVEAYKYAAEKGHPGARWALANMYAYGDGVVENDYEAFKIYDDIARQGVEPGSQDTGYFVNALSCRWRTIIRPVSRAARSRPILALHGSSISRLLQRLVFPRRNTGLAA